MRLLQFCFVLMVFGSSAKAQDTLTCFYHISFGHWQWNYCYGGDTIQVHDLNGEFIKDSVVYRNSSHPDYFIFDLIHRTQVAVSYLTVTSMDGETKYKVSGYDIIANSKSPDIKTVHTKDATTGVDGIDLLYKAKKGDHFQLNNIKIINPVTKKEVVLPGIYFDAE